MTTNRRRVAVLGFMHEVNALAEPTALDSGTDIRSTAGGLSCSWDVGPAIARMREDGSIDVLEGPVWEFGAGGPLSDDDFGRVHRSILDALISFGRIDGVLFMGHGAGRTIGGVNSDVAILQSIRATIGDRPLVAVLDFHANLSGGLCDMVDVIVGYRTNPHVDVAERAVEAAEQVHRLMHETLRTVRLHVKLPLILPQIAQLTTPDEPLGEVMQFAAARTSDRILNVSLFGGFSLADSPDSGVSVCVTSPEQHSLEAKFEAELLAKEVWNRRDRFRRHGTSVEQAITIAVDAVRGSRSPVILADLADNPGGGAPANSTYLLSRLLESGIDQAIIGLHCDQRVVEAAQSSGIGTTNRIVFNEHSSSKLAERLAVDARVVALAKGTFVPSRGIYRGSRRDPGACCALEIAGITIAVSSRPLQCADSDTFEHLGLDPSKARVVVVKSRGHFRAGFDHLFSPDQVIEVEAPGIATNHLTSRQWARLPRPSFPFDADIEWHPRASLHGTPTS